MLFADDAMAAVGGAPSSVSAAIARLTAAGVIRPLTRRTRDQVWIAASVADELDNVAVRIRCSGAWAVMDVSAPPLDDPPGRAGYG